MKTTALIIEWLIGGVLVSLALVALAASFFPDEVRLIWSWLNRLPSVLANDAVLATVFTASVYAVGVLSEFVGFTLFEPLLDQIKKEQFTRYLKANRETLMRSQILRGYNTIPESISVHEASSRMGEMRFYVLMKSPELYSEIESQMNRFRLIRILFMVEAILGLAIARQLLRLFSIPLACALAAVLALVCVNWLAVRSRFHRYCRAVERAYRVLVLD
jgi:hypothetical protein